MQEHAYYKLPFFANENLLHWDHTRTLNYSNLIPSLCKWLLPTSSKSRADNRRKLKHQKEDA